VSESALDVLRRAHITGPRNTTVVCNPIEPAEVVPTGRAQKTGRDLVVGYLGCENVSKGVLVLPEIAELLRRHPVELVCVMKGWPPERNTDEVNDALDQLRSLSPPVRFRLRDHDVRNIYAELDALLVPSLAESFCRIAAEAMLNRLPVVASDLPALRELSGDGQSALLFPVGNGAAAAARILELSKDPELSRRLGASGHSRTGSFLPRHVADQLLSLYRLELPIDIREVDAADDK
jgi:glycosyltransferase involved in cell wall biosynthesis